MQYYLMYNNLPVLEFDLNASCGKVLHKSMLPFCIKDITDGWLAINIFCNIRVMSMNRKYSKEILCSCNINDQTNLNICIISHALSFRDNYWIKEKQSALKWQDVNLYDNEFSLEIADVALTGEQKSVIIDDRLFTGELTGKGTRSKCFMRQSEKIVLIKEETFDEIASEIIAYYIAKALNISCTRYASIKIYDRDCSVCLLQTSNNKELIPCRDIMQRYHDSEMSKSSAYFNEIMSYDNHGFLQMMIFDYVTLNTDRNRDNFGLLQQNGQIIGLYPLFDHDSCFKGKSEDANYFVTGMSFRDTASYLRSVIHSNVKIMKELQDGLEIMRENNFKQFFLEYKNLSEYEGMISRLQKLITKTEKDSIKKIAAFQN